MASLSVIFGSSSYFSQNLFSAHKLSFGSFIPHQLIRAPFARMYSSKINRGDIFIIQHSRRFEKGDIVSSKDSKRPGLVISSNKAIAKTNHVVFANITSKISSIYPFEVYIQSDTKNGLDEDSKIMTNQLFTLPKKAVTHSSRSRKIGSLNVGDQEKVDRGLRINLSSIHEKTKPKFSRGTVVETHDSSGDLVYGVIVSNDIGNLRSRIVILSPTRPSTVVDKVFQVNVQIKNTRTSTTQTMRVDCNEIDSAPQSLLKVAGKISEMDLQKIESKIFLGLALDNEE